MNGLNEEHLKKVLAHRKRIGYAYNPKNLLMQIEAGLVRTVSCKKENHDG